MSHPSLVARSSSPVIALVGVALAVGCGRDGATIREAPAPTADAERADGSLTDTDAIPDVLTAPDGLAADAKSPVDAGGPRSQDAAPSKDGGASLDADATAGTVAGIYQGPYKATSSGLAATGAYSGKMAIKAREDGIFSGTGTGSNADNTIWVSLSLSGALVADGVSTATLLWTWPTEGPGAMPPATLEATGQLDGDTFTLSFVGGDRSAKLQGTATLTRLP